MSTWLVSCGLSIADPPDVQPLEWVYSQPHINWTVTEANRNLWSPGSGETSGESWVYFDLYNADLHSGTKNEVLILPGEDPLHTLRLAVSLMCG